jgi:hypothetical protein
VLTASTRNSVDYDLNTGVAVLRIDSVQLNDIGEYLVVAENPAGKDQTQCRVEITLVPNIDQTPYVNPDAFKNLEKLPLVPKEEIDAEMKPPKVIIPLTDVKLVEGQPIHLACKIEGIPRPRVIKLFILK